MKRYLIMALMLALLALAFAQTGTTEITRSRPASVTPVNYKNVMADYFQGNYLFPISYNVYSSSVEGLGSMSSLSLNVLKLGITGIEGSETDKQFLVLQGGLMDHMGAGVLNVNDAQYEIIYGDLLSAYAGITKPLANYQAYVNAGLKLSLFGQMPIVSEMNVLNGDYIYVYDFEKDGTSYTTQRTNDPSLGMEFSIRGGLRVYQNLFASVAVGVRYNSSESGNWYLKSDVQDWENGAAIFEPDPWYHDTFPKNNSFFDGATPFLSITVSPSF